MDIWDMEHNGGVCVKWLGKGQWPEGYKGRETN